MAYELCSNVEKNNEREFRLVFLIQSRSNEQSIEPMQGIECKWKCLFNNMYIWSICNSLHLFFTQIITKLKKEGELELIFNGSQNNFFK